MNVRIKERIVLEDSWTAADMAPHHSTQLLSYNQ